jgi:hypothetical protein
MASSIDDSLADQISVHNARAMGHPQLVRATGDFATVLGQGAFATVYLGKIGGKSVAVKVDSPKLLKEGEKIRLVLEQQYAHCYGDAALQESNTAAHTDRQCLRRARGGDGECVCLAT